MSVLTGIRDFTAMIPSYQGVHDGSSWSTKKDKTLPVDGNGWSANGSNTCFFETYIDLSALQLDDLTLIPLECGLQDPGFYTESDGSTEMIVMDIISQQRLEGSMLTNFMNPVLNQFNNAPGMSGLDIDYHMVTMGNLRILYKSNQVSTTSTLIPFLTQFSSPFGSGAPIAVEKLWCYRFVYYAGRNTEAMQIPAARFTLRGEVAKEKPYVYINRLKNSYESL
jgi:hypothetical protein